MAVYVDVLLVLNFMMDFVLLRLSGLPTGRRFVGKWAALAACEGAISSLIIFLPFHGVLFMGIYKLAVSALMVATAFEFLSPFQFLKDVFSLFAVSFLFSGAMTALWLFFSPRGMLLYNGVVYFDVSAISLIIATVFCYLVTTALSRLMQRRSPKEELCTVVIQNSECEVSLRVLLDSGNSLVEPFSGYPVIVGYAGDLKGVLPEAFFEGTSQDLDPAKAAALRMRMVPFHSVGGQGVLPSFRPGLVKLLLEGGEREVQDVYVAVSPNPIGTAEYQAIMNPTLVLRNIGKAGEVLWKC